VWTVEVSVLHLQRLSVFVHLFEEILNEVRVVVELETTYLVDVLVSVPPLGEDKFAEVLSQRESCVVARGQHHAVEELLGSKDVALFELCGCASDVRCDAADLDLHLAQFEFVLPRQINHRESSHHLS